MRFSRKYKVLPQPVIIAATNYMLCLLVSIDTIYSIFFGIQNFQAKKTTIPCQENGSLFNSDTYNK